MLAIALATLGMTAVPSAIAQLNTPNPSGSAQAASPYTDAELKSFAAAAMAVQQIRDVYASQLAGANDADEQQQLTAAAIHAMAQAIAQQGLSVDRFRDILVSAQRDPALVDKINQQLNAPDEAQTPGNDSQQSPGDAQGNPGEDAEPTPPVEVL